MLNMSPVTSSKYKLTSAYKFVIDNEVFYIPVKFKFDGASIPRVFWTVIGNPFNPRFVEAALVHDYLISIGYDGIKRDKHFKSMLLKAGVGKIKAHTMFMAVMVYRKVRKYI